MKRNRVKLTFTVAKIDYELLHEDTNNPNRIHGISNQPI